MACEGLSDWPHRPQVFSTLVLAGTGVLAFQGLSRGDDLLNGGQTRLSESGRDRPSRPGCLAKSTPALNLRNHGQSL